LIFLFFAVVVFIVAVGLLPAVFQEK